MNVNNKAANTIHALFDVLNEYLLAIRQARNENNDDEEAELSSKLLIYIRLIDNGVALIKSNKSINELEALIGTDVDQIYKESFPDGVGRNMKLNEFEALAAQKKDTTTH